MTNTLHSVPLQTSGHLSEEDLDDVLIGCATAETARHAAECVICGAQIRAFQSSMISFNAGTMAWAQAKSNTVSRDLSSARLSGASQQVRWSMGVATMAAMACVLAVGLHRSPADVAQVPVEQASSVSSPQEIDADNQMLEAINSEIGTDVPAPLQTYRPASGRVQGSRQNSVNGARN